MAKYRVLISVTDRTINWGRANGFPQLMDELLEFKEVYQKEWRKTMKRNGLNKKLAALDEQRAKIVDELNKI